MFLPDPPARSPEPPHDLNALALPLIEWSGPVVRIHQTVHDPIWFNPNAVNRFNNSVPNTFGTLYLGTDFHGAFIECFGESAGRLVNTSYLEARSVSTIIIQNPVSLVDIRGNGAAQIGAAGEITAGSHPLSRLWATNLWAHPSAPHGILYRARHDLERNSIALWDRAMGDLSLQSTIGMMHDDNLKQLGEVLDHYNFGLD